MLITNFHDRHGYEATCLDYELAPSAGALSTFSQCALPQAAFNPKINTQSHCLRFAGLSAECPAEK